MNNASWDYKDGPNPMIISAGDDWREWDPGLWGTRDRATHAHEERTRAALRLEQAKLRLPETEFAPLPTGPVSDATAFQLDPPRRPRRNARGKAIDALIEKHVGRRR